MARKRTLTLTDDERQALIDHREHDRRPQARERCAALLKIAEGASPHWVSQHGLLKRRSPDTVYAWLDMYEETGLDGVLSRLHGGRRPRGP
jgi:transposase